VWSLATPVGRQQYLSVRPDASNRAVGAALGIPHKSQVSRLLTALEKEGIVTKHPTAPGAPNEWRLSAHGEQVGRALTEREQAGGPRRRA
jgi:DNA-binding IclR family transcriptional regulator